MSNPDDRPSEEQPADKERPEKEPADTDRPERTDKDPAAPRPQQVQVPSVTARVPPSLGHGVMSTGAIVMNGPHVFVLDFLQQMGVPSHLVRRVVLPQAVVPRFIQALEQNLANYQQKFGPPMKIPRPVPPSPPPSIEEIYDNIKVHDEELAGHFAEGVMIRHTAAEFCFDFVTQFFPYAAVSSRIFLSAPHVPPLLEALKANYQRFAQGPGPSRPAGPDPSGTPETQGDPSPPSDER